jgi:hypothetical protein
MRHIQAGIIEPHCRIADQWWILPRSTPRGSMQASGNFILPVIVAFVDEDVVADLPGDNVELRPSGFR